MNFLELVKKRQSDRDYLDKPVERDKLERCLQAAHLAPSACNAQPWHFIVLDEPKIKDAVAKETVGPLGTLNRFTQKAPVLIIIVGEEPNISSKIGGKIKNKPYHLIDIGIAAEHVCLQAAEEGLGTCLLGWFDEKAIKNILNIPHAKRIELLISIGYPAGQTRIKNRKPFEKIVSFNKY